MLAAFADGARVRAETLAHLAGEIGGAPLHEQVGALLGQHPPDADLAAAYGAQERATLLIAEHLDNG